MGFPTHLRQPQQGVEHVNTICVCAAFEETSGVSLRVLHSFRKRPTMCDGSGRIGRRRRRKGSELEEDIRARADGSEDIRARAEGSASTRAHIADLQSKLPSYAELQQMEKLQSGLGKRSRAYLRGMSNQESERMSTLLRGFQRSSTVRDKALAIYVSGRMWRVLSSRFVDFLLSVMDHELACTLTAIAEFGDTQLFDNTLFPYFADFVLDKHKDEAVAYRDKVDTVDLREPWQWYPVARALSRRLIYHAGPTNSGKTHNALEAFKQAPSGMYCGPLRLLAMEVFDRMNSEGTLCNLVTGQEKKIVPGASHTACTIETVPLNLQVDVAVIDEVQMLGDDARGWAWTRALQGVAANEIHLCGDGSAVDLVRRMAKDMKEPLEIRRYDRFTPIKIEEGTLRRGYMSVQPGDCVVAFSRREIFDIKSMIEKDKGFGVCVVYGALPPEMRRQQARLFNEPDNDYKVLVASDAVGMGLNLNIRRVIFHRLDKWEGEARVPVSISQIKQIAGRAGRRGTAYPEGIATTLNAEDLPRLREAIATPHHELITRKAGLFPEFDMLEAYASKLLTDDYAGMLETLGQQAQLDGLHFFCRQDSLIRTARLLANIPLSLQDRHWFCSSPVNQRDARQMAALQRFAELYSQKRPVLLELPISQNVPATYADLQVLESLHQEIARIIQEGGGRLGAPTSLYGFPGILVEKHHGTVKPVRIAQVASLYLWLANRLPEEFPFSKHAEDLSERYITLMDAGLKAMYGHSVGLRDTEPAPRRLDSTRDRNDRLEFVGAAA